MLPPYSFDIALKIADTVVKIVLLVLGTRNETHNAYTINDGNIDIYKIVLTLNRVHLTINSYISKSYNT